MPDPDDERCPVAFREQVQKLLGSHQYQPYRDIPYTTEKDALADTPRNRLLTFIAKFSSVYAEHAKHGGKSVPSKEVLESGSLVKWEASCDDRTLSIARQLLRAANGGERSAVLDPFAGGGAIPLEAARLGCDSFANELNPVAHLVERCALEFPQTYGKRAEFSASEYLHLYGTPPAARLATVPTIKNRLAHDVEYWARSVLEGVRKEIGNLYPTRYVEKVPVAYYWVRTAPCSNPSCRAAMPLFRSLWLCRKPNKRVALRILVDKASRRISYEVVQGKAIDFDPSVGLNVRGNVRCPLCSEVTPVKEIRAAAKRGDMQDDLVVVIEDSASGKEYRLADQEDRRVFELASRIPAERPAEAIPEDQWNVKTWLYGMNSWGSLFNQRQIVAVQAFVSGIRQAQVEMKRRGWEPDYARAVAAYLGLWLDRIVQRMSSVGIWHVTRETLEHPFGRQAIPMTWDYPEANPLSITTGSASNQLDWILAYILRESNNAATMCIQGSAASIFRIRTASMNAVITDPPYYDAISYADLSDFFYVWLKRTVGDEFTDVFRTPLTPKAEECTSVRHRFGSEDEAQHHFESLLTVSFAEAKRMIRDDGVVSIMFAHQSTEAWTAFVKAILDAGLSITASWPLDTENVDVGIKAAKSMLASSVTVVCRKRVVGVAASFHDIKHELQEAIATSLDRVWKLGFRGADLIVSTFGPAVGVFGKYERVEKADGTEVTVPELLELVREMAFREIVQELPADDLTRAYVAWLNLYSTTTAPYDRAQKTIQMGTKEDIGDVADRHRLFIRDGSDVRAALVADRADMGRLGEPKDAPEIDRVHRVMLFWRRQDRTGLVRFLVATGSYSDDAFWRTLQALREVLPGGTEDAKLVMALLAERESLIAAAKQKSGAAPTLL